MRERERGRKNIGHHANTVICKAVLSCSYWSSSVRDNRLRERWSRSLAIGRIVFREFFTGFPGLTRGDISTFSTPAAVAARNRRGLFKSRWIVLLLVLSNLVFLLNLKSLSFRGRSERGRGEFEEPVSAVKEGKVSLTL